MILEFVEAGTEQAADLGYGDETYFGALERRVNEIVRALNTLSNTDGSAAIARLIRLGEYEGAIGWKHVRQTRLLDYLRDQSCLPDLPRPGDDQHEPASLA